MEESDTSTQTNLKMAPSNSERDGEDRVSQVLSRLEAIEATLKDIEANTRSEDEKKYVFRGSDKVCLFFGLYIFYSHNIWCS